MTAERIWLDRVSAPLEMCRAKGREHRAYGWARERNDLWTGAQQFAYNWGYDGKES